MVSGKKILFAVLFLTFLLISCNKDDMVAPDEETLLFEKQGLVDSVVVYGCYAHSRTFTIPDTLSLSGFSKLKAEFDGYANSDGTIIFVFVTSPEGETQEIYRATDLFEINKIHSLQAALSYQDVICKVMLYINPPVCGVNEFKYNRVRNLKIYGVK